MKRTTLLFLLVIVSSKLFLQQLPLNVSSSSGSFFLTCANPNINLTASGANSYTWQGPGGVSGGSTLAVNMPGTYTLSGATQSLSSTITFVINSNTVAPVVNVNPAMQNITCGNGATTVTMSVNGNSYYDHIITQPQAVQLNMIGGQVFFTPGSAGSYSLLTTDSLNGCSTQSTFTAATSDNFPTFGVVSAQNFTLGCSTQSVATINIINALTTPPGGAVSFSLQGPPTSSVLGSGPLSSNTTFSMNQAGTWTITVRDNATLCDAKAYINIISNTVPPSVSVANNSVLSCLTPSTILMASSNANATFVWTFPGSPGTANGYSIPVVANTGAPTMTLVTQFTLTVTDNNNNCQSTQVIPVLQNLFRPSAQIVSGGVYSLTCLSPTVVLTNASTSGIPSGTFPNNQPVTGFLWDGPVPQTTLAMSSTYLAYTVGTYTLIAQDSNNGCTSMTTIVVGDARVYPVVNNPEEGVICLNGLSTAVSPVISGSSANLTYSWSAPANATVVGLTSPTLLTNAPGYYTISVTNTISGCRSSSQMTVELCSGMEQREIIKASIFPNPTNGAVFLNKTGSSEEVAEVYNSLGQRMIRQELKEGSNQIDLQHLPAGIYMISIVNDTGSVHYKNIIKN